MIAKSGVLLCLLWASICNAQDGGFVRFLDGTREWQGQLQTAIGSYRDAAGREVNLVAAIHIADLAYYSMLNEFFTTQDLVLYEMVAEPDQRPGPQSVVTGGSPLGMVQTLVARLLEVEFQLQQIDYTPLNFRHADLSPAQLGNIMEEKDENFFTMIFDVAMAQQASAQSRNLEPGELKVSSLLMALSMENQSQALKYLLARELGRTDSLLLDPQLEAGLTLLGDRNRVAIARLEEALQETDKRSISLFYGAAHMPGLERAIRAMGFQEVKRSWLTAWAIE
jgi:hypothetical protein